MKQYFDTSVLIAAFVEDERHHEACSQAVADAEEGIVLALGLAECFAILTGGRLSVQLSATLAAEIINVNVFQRMSVLTLTPKETFSVFQKAQSNGVRGGGIYDALHLAAARKAKADRIFTLNVRRFSVFAPDLAERIVEPE